MKSIRRFLAALIMALVTVNAYAGHVLVVLSDADHLDLKDGKVYPTGFYLNELMQPVKRFIDAGHVVTFATPTGAAPAVDGTSLDKMYFGNDEAALKAHQSLLEQLQITSALRSPVISLSRVEQIGYDRFDAVYVPGGHAPMQDLLYSKQLGKLLNFFHANQRTTALVCHGPIALLSTLDDSQGLTRALENHGRAARPDWIYAGYKLTVISNQEEELAKGLLAGGTMKFYPQAALEQAGARYERNSGPWMPHVVVDRELITGQNPASALPVAEQVLARLK